MAPPGPPPIFDPNSPFSMARQTQPSPTETVVATPRSVSPAATLASSFPSLKLDKAADSSADVLPACQEIPRVGQSDDAPHRIDGFTYLTIGGDVFRSGEKLTSVYKEKTDAKLRPISSSMLENRDDLNVTPRKAGHDQRSQFRFADSSANGSIHFEPDNLRDYSGSLWRIHTGKLSFIPSTIDRQYRKTPAILKLVWLSRFRDAPPRDWTFLEEHHTCDTARNEALNEDRTLRGLFDFQGGIVPSYYGLYTWSKANREPSKSNPPQVLAMVMEDVGPYPLERPRFSTDEIRAILKMYEDLHYNGHIIHNGLYFKPRHILRRRPQKDGEQPSFVLVDFQKSSSLKAVPEEDLPDALGLEDWALMDNLGYNFVRGSDFRLYDHQRDLICGYQAPWPLLRGAV